MSGGKKYKIKDNVNVKEKSNLPGCQQHSEISTS